MLEIETLVEFGVVTAATLGGIVVTSVEEGTIIDKFDRYSLPPPSLISSLLSKLAERL